MAAAFATVVIGGNAFAAGVKLLTTIDIPGEELKLFDIGVVDAAAGRYYIADRSNKGVDIFDTKTNKYVGRVDGFVGVVMKDGKPVGSLSGPNGVALDAKNKELWVGDGDSTLKVIDLKSNPPKISQTIATGGTKRADELAIDSKDGIVLAFNNADKPTFGLFVSTKPGHKILARSRFRKPPTASSNRSTCADRAVLFLGSGMEGGQQAGRRRRHRSKTMKMLRLINIPGCQPTGLMQGPGTNMLVGCAAGKTAPRWIPPPSSGTGSPRRSSMLSRKWAAWTRSGTIPAPTTTTRPRAASPAGRCSASSMPRPTSGSRTSRPPGRPFGRRGFQDQACLRAAHREPELPEELHRSLRREVVAH